MNAIRHRVCVLALLPLFLLLALAGAPISTPAQTAARIVGPINNTNRVTLKGNVHPLARAEFARGDAAPSQPMNRMLLLLKRSDAQETALQALLDSQQDKSSPSYHQWLSPSDFGNLYGPADSDIQAVTDWLQSQGFAVNKVYSGKTVVEFSGNAAQVQTAFGATIRNYQVQGRTFVANANDPQIPAALAPVVAGIVSLNNFPRQSHARLAGLAQKVAGKPGIQPLFTTTYYGDTFYAVAPGDFATIYGSRPLLTGGNDGTGQTIAVVGETNINVADVKAFRQIFGLSANFDTPNIILNGEDPGIISQGEELEADLDVEWSGAVAPGATVKFVVSASTPASAGIDLSALYIIENNLAGVLSESYGACETALGTGGNAFYNALWEQAAAQGITAVLSAGDAGSAGCDDFNSATVATQGLAVSGIASTPYNVALGGTDFDDVNTWSNYWSASNSASGTSALKYIPEIPWNVSCAQLGATHCGSAAPQGSLNIVAGSGGPSKTYGKPKWQMGVTGMPNDNHRDLPDVSLFASSGFDYSGYAVCAGDGTATSSPQCSIDQGSYDITIVGGTSASAPAFAGIMALVNQYQSAHGGQARQGNANYVLYPLAKKSGSSCTSSATEAAGCVFNDVVKGNSAVTGGVGTNSVPCQGLSPNCSSTVSGTNGVLVDPAHTSTEAWTVTAGYDLVTGLGSVNINNLVTKWGTVSTVATTTTLTLNPVTGITHGSGENVTVNVTVTPSSGTAAGDVSLIAKFADGTTQGLDQFTLDSSGKIVSSTTDSLPGGNSYQVYAHYTGDGTNAPSDSAPVTVSVGKEASQTFIVVPSYDSNGNLLSGNATSVSYGSNYIIRMYVANSAAKANGAGAPTGTCDTINLLTCPTGTVTLTDNGSASGTGGGGAGIFNLNSAGYTRNLTPTLTGGTHTLVASYSGDDSYNPSTSVNAAVTITPASVSMSQEVFFNSILVGEAFPVSISATSPALSGVAPTGTITFYDGSIQLGNSVPIQSPGAGYAPIFSAGSDITILNAGPRTLIANYSGDSNYAAATTSTNINVLNPTSITESESSTVINYGQSTTITATITSTSKNPPMTGQVEFMGSSTSISSVVTTSGTDSNGNQILTATATITPQFSTHIAAQYGGDSYYAPIFYLGDLVTVNARDFSLTPNPPSPTVTVGQSGSIQMGVVPSGNLSGPPVSLSCSGPYTPYPGDYTCSITPSTVNASNGKSDNATITFAPSPPQSTEGVVKGAKRSGFPLFPSGSNPWWLFGPITALLSLVFLRNDSGWRRSLSFASLCFCILVISCGGGSSSSGGGGGGGGGGLAPSTVTLTSDAPKIASGGTFNLTAKVSGKGNPSGLVDFYFNGLYWGPQRLYAGVATLQVTAPPPAVYQVTAHYEGDAVNSPSTSAPLAQAVTGSETFQVQGVSGLISHSVDVTVTFQ